MAISNRRHKGDSLYPVPKLVKQFDPRQEQVSIPAEIDYTVKIKPSGALPQKKEPL